MSDAPSPRRAPPSLRPALNLARTPADDPAMGVTATGPARPGARRRRPRVAVAVTASAAAVVTAVIALTPGLHFAYRNPDLHVALLTAEALIAMLTAYLAFGRLKRRRRLDDLALGAAFAVMAASNLLFAALPAVIASDTSAFSTWSSLVGRLVGAALLACAALVPARRTTASPRRLRIAAALVAGTLVVVAAAAALAGPALLGTVAVAAAEDSNRPRLESPAGILAAQLAGFALLVVAAIGFTARAERTGDALPRWLAVAAVLSAAARLNYFLYPSLFTEYVYTGDAFRLLFYVVVLAAALSEIRWYWRGMAERAALEERRRIARELHDGLAQELAGVKRNLKWLDPADRAVARALASAERAEAESRRAVAALADEHVGALDVALADAARRIGEREGAQVVVSVDGAVRLPAQHRDELVRIASEAMVNAVRHGRADVVRVEMTGGRRPRLLVEDAGIGFDVRAGAGSGRHGLRTMRERAESLGAELRVESDAGRGTRVQVIL